MPVSTESRVTRQEVLNKCEFFSDVHVWPLAETLDPERWLSNFLPEEEEYALNLLQSFMYMSEGVCDALFKSSFHSLSKPSIQRLSSAREGSGIERWRHLVDNAIFTYVTGEVPRPTDSGYAFARRARQLLGIDEGRIVSPDDAMLRVSQRPAPIVFVDDFVGSGDQFTHTWHRKIRIAPGHLRTFEELATANSSDFIYIPLVATAHGVREINSSCNGCQIHPAHLLPDTYSALHPESVIWPEGLRSGAGAFLESASRRAGIPDMDGNEGDWRGFQKLALTLAFHHKVPDATLPLFTWDENNSNPLMRGRS